MRLGDYEVTSLPRRPALRLLWTPARGGEKDDQVVVQDPPPAPLALLVPYRITRVPARAAS